MSKVIIALIFAAFVGLSFQCSKPTGRCSTPCSTNFPSNGKCNYAPMIARHEGCCECTYLDSLGKPTIGIGYLMVPSRASQLQSVGANYESLVTGQSQLNMEQITQLFNIYVQSSIQVAQKTYSNWNKLCCNVEQALVDIIYDLNNGISAFHTFNAAINSENWTGAAAALQNSLFCKQVGQRCTDDANLIKQGCPKTSSTPSKSGNPNAGNNSAPKNNEESKASSSKASSSKTSAQASNPNSSQQSGSQQSGSQQSGSQQSGSQQSGSQQSGSQQSGSQQSGSQQSGSASNSQQSGSASNSQQSGSGSASNSGSQQSSSGSAASSSAKSSKSSSSSTRQH